MYLGNSRPCSRPFWIFFARLRRTTSSGCVFGVRPDNHVQPLQGGCGPSFFQCSHHRSVPPSRRRGSLSDVFSTEAISDGRGRGSGTSAAASRSWKAFGTCWAPFVEDSVVAFFRPDRGDHEDDHNVDNVHRNTAPDLDSRTVWRILYNYEIYTHTHTHIYIYIIYHHQMEGWQY